MILAFFFLKSVWPYSNPIHSLTLKRLRSKRKRSRIFRRTKTAKMCGKPSVEWECWLSRKPLGSCNLSKGRNIETRRCCIGNNLDEGSGDRAKERWRQKELKISSLCSVVRVARQQHQHHHVEDHRSTTVVLILFKSYLLSIFGSWGVNDCQQRSMYV